MGKVKTFNSRFRQRYDESAVGHIDPRETAEFQMLDSLITSFRLSVPKEYKKPVSLDGKLDPTLYVTLLLPHM